MDGLDHQRLAEAFNYAATAHSSQVRKVATIPYVSHPVSVFALRLRHGGDEDQTKLPRPLTDEVARTLAVMRDLAGGAE